VNDSLVVWQVRVSQEQEHFLLNPFGLLYSEVTASSLIKVDMQVKKKSQCRAERLYAFRWPSACDDAFGRFPVAGTP
jgi:ribulose-5-phosphate 4-epimerase/fuculose-1-phosphate aldolase